MLISDWLNSDEQDYSKGVALFEKHHGSSVVLRLLHQGRNSFTASLLKEELKKLIDSAGASTDLPPDLPQPISQTHCDTSEDSLNKKEESSGVVGEAAPKELQPLIQERQKLYRERDYMKAKLPHVRGKSRAEYAIKVVTNTYRIDDLWTAIEHFNNTGVLIHPDDKQKKSARDMFKVEREINNARSNLSKHKKAGKTELFEKWKVILKDLENEKKEILNAV